MLLSSQIFRSRSFCWLLALHLLLTLPLALGLNLWIDEAYSLDTTQLGVWATGQQAITFENQPPLYFVLLSLWRSLGDYWGVTDRAAIGWARLFSVFCLAQVVVLAFPLARRYCPGIKPGWVVGAIAFNPYCIWAATEIRTYGFALLLSAMLLLGFFEGYWQKTEEGPNSAGPLGKARSRSLGWRGFHAGVAIASLYTNYFLGSLLIAQGAVLLLTRRWRSLRTYTAWMIGVSLLFVPMLFVLASHLAGQGSGMDLQTDSTAQALQTMLGQSLLYLWPSAFLSQHFSMVAGLRYGGLLGLGSIAIAYRKQLSEMQLVLVTLVVVCFASLTFVLDITENATLTARYSYPLFLPILLLLFSCLSLLPRKVQQRALWSWGAIALICYGGTLIHQYPDFAKDGDWSRVARFIQAHETTEQPVVVFSAEAVLPLKYYYDGVNPLVSLPEQSLGEAYNLRRFVIRDKTQIRQVLIAQQTPNDLPSEFWLVKGPRYALEGTEGVACHIWGIDLNCAALEQFIQDNYRLEQQKEFYGSKVQLLSKLSTSFTVAPAPNRGF
jgi:hypothetical protein